MDSAYCRISLTASLDDGTFFGFLNGFLGYGVPGRNLVRISNRIDFLRGRKNAQGDHKISQIDSTPALFCAAFDMPNVSAAKRVWTVNLLCTPLNELVHNAAGDGNTLLIQRPRLIATELLEPIITFTIIGSN